MSSTRKGTCSVVGIITERDYLKFATKAIAMHD